MLSGDTAREASQKDGGFSKISHCTADLIIIKMNGPASQLGSQPWHNINYHVEA